MNNKFKIGIDCGGSKIEAILLDPNGNEIIRKRSTYEKNYNSIIKVTTLLIRELEVKANNPCTIGIGIPGFSSKETGLVVNANTNWLNNKPFKNDLENVLKKKK